MIGAHFTDFLAMQAIRDPSPDVKYRIGYEDGLWNPTNVAVTGLERQGTTKTWVVQYRALRAADKIQF
jgi:hypothetical protein